MASSSTPGPALDDLVFTHELRRHGGGEPDQVALEQWVTRAHRLPHVDLNAPDTGDELAGAETVAEAICYGLDPMLAAMLDVNPFVAADAHSGDAQTYYTALFKPDGEPRDELCEATELWPSSALALHRVWVAPGLRGRGLAGVIASEALLTLARAYAVCACYPAADRDDIAGGAITQAGLERLVARWGFTPLHEGVWICDLALADPLERLAAARTRRPHPPPARDLT